MLLWRCKYCPTQKLSSCTRVEAHLLLKSGRGISKCPRVTCEMLSEMGKEVERCKELVERVKQHTVSLPTVPYSGNDSKKIAMFLVCQFLILWTYGELTKL